jgi:hypothetical protein
MAAVSGTIFTNHVVVTVYFQHFIVAIGLPRERDDLLPLAKMKTDSHRNSPSQLKSIERPFTNLIVQSVRPSGVIVIKVGLWILLPHHSSAPNPHTKSPWPLSNSRKKHWPAINTHG